MTRDLKDAINSPTSKISETSSHLLSLNSHKFLRSVEADSRLLTQ